KGVAHVDREALQVGKRVASAGEPEVERARVADAGDVECVAVEQQRQGRQGIQARAVQIQRLLGARHVRYPDVERNRRASGQAGHQARDVGTVDQQRV